MDRKGSLAEMTIPDPNKTGAHRGEIDRLVEKGRAKDAFKQAKWYFHREQNGENRKLVEYTYICRIRELIRGGMTSAAREVALSALEFGVTDADYLKELTSKLPVLGMMDQALQLRDRLGSTDSADAFSETLADQAVVHPEAIKDSMPDLYSAVEPIRSAFSALDAGDETRALDSLRSIPRHSPQADWRYFIRGLISFRKRNVEQAKNDWDRLNPTRAAKKIAQTLLAVAEIAPESALDDRLKSLEKAACGEPVLERIAELRAALNKADWKRVLKSIGPVQKTLNGFDPRVAERFTQIVLSSLSAEIMNQSFRKAAQMLHSAQGAIEPLPWDPHWNRFQAILWEGPRGDAYKAIDCWEGYLKDLEKGISAFSPEETIQVQALVWRHIGVLLLDRATDDEDKNPFIGLSTRHGRPQWNVDHTRAVNALERSLALDPKQKKAYKTLLYIYAQFDRTKEAIALLEALLEEFPDDVDALSRLIRLYRRTDEAEKMLNRVERYRKLKPLDASAALDESCARLALARRLTAKKHREAGRAEFDRVENAKDNPLPSFVITACRAAFEFKAGEDERGRELVERAQIEAKHPASALLALAIEAVRYGLAKASRDRCVKLFKTALSTPPTSESAAELAELMSFYLEDDMKFAHRGERIKDVVVYLRKTNRVKYRENDLRIVCDFLYQYDDSGETWLKFAKLGRKLFPKSVYFLLVDIESDLLFSGPIGLNPKKIRKKLQGALDSIDPAAPTQDAQLIPKLKAMIHKMDDLDRPGFPFPFPFSGDEAPEFSDKERNMFEEFFSQFSQMNFGFYEGDDDDDDDDDEPAPQRRKPTQKRKRK